MPSVSVKYLLLPKVSLNFLNFSSSTFYAFSIFKSFSVISRGDTFPLSVPNPDLSS